MPPVAEQSSDHDGNPASLHPGVVQPQISVSLFPIAGLDRLLVIRPPPAVTTIPVDRLCQTLLEISVQRLPIELPPYLSGIDGIPTITSRAVCHQIEFVGPAPHEAQNHPEHLHVAQLAIRADKVGRSRRSMDQDAPNGPAIILHVNPIPDRSTMPINPRTDS